MCLAFRHVIKFIKGIAHYGASLQKGPRAWNDSTDSSSILDMCTQDKNARHLLWVFNTLDRGSRLLDLAWTHLPAAVSHMLAQSFSILFEVAMKWIDVLAHVHYPRHCQMVDDTRTDAHIAGIWLRDEHQEFDIAVSVRLPCVRKK